MEILKIIGAVITLMGSIALLIGALGLVRMPDLYNRIQTGTKASTFGTVLTLLGLIFIFPGWVGKLIILMLFVGISNPVSSHVLARNAYRYGVPLSDKTTVDRLAEDIENNEVEPVNDAQ